MRNFSAIVLGKCENCRKLMVGRALTVLMEDVARVIVDGGWGIFKEESINWLHSAAKMGEFILLPYV